jgi:hypothetical protein
VAKTVVALKRGTIGKSLEATSMRCAITLLTLFAAISTVTAKGATIRPAEFSPIAVEDEYVYAVSDDRKHVIRKEITGGQWEKYDVDASFGEITGLAAHAGILYVVDQTAAAVSKIQLAHHIASPVFVGDPLFQPGEISTGDNELYILDGRKVFRLDHAGMSQTSVHLNDSVPTPARMHLGSSKDQLALTNASQGLLLSIADPDTPERSQLSTLLCRDPRCMVKTGSSTTEPSIKDILPTFDAERVITRPGSVSIRSGIIYVVDEERHQIFASSRHTLSPVQMFAKRPPLYLPSSIVVTDNNIVALDEKTRDTVVWPLLVPAEVVVDVKNSEGMAALYKYLYREGILPTKSRSLDGSIGKTLHDERVLLSPYVESLNPLICALNPSLCINGKPKPVRSSGVPIILPDVYSESFVEPRVVTLDGTHSLNVEVDRAVKSDALGEWKTEARLLQMNPQYRKQDSLSILDERTGTFTTPVESVRYFIGLPSNQLKDKGSSLGQLKHRYAKTLAISSLEEVQGKAQGDTNQYLVKCDQQSFDAAYKILLNTINYARPPTESILVAPVVGVAESLQDLDCGSPDFDGVVCSPQTSTISATPQSIPVTYSAISTFRNFALSDHANAVVSLIAAHHTDFNGPGLAAPEALVVPIANTDPPIGEDIRRAALAGTRIFNLSLAFDENVVPPTLGKYLNHDSQDAITNALFVVSATDDGKQVCGTSMRFPICWGAQNNVIVVAGTLIDGNSLIPNLGGSKWGAKFVHVAAPGVGFGASGRDRGYVPVAGASFAAPLVTAAAALLFEQNVTDPVLIKQRLVATSKVVADYQGKIAGGLLDVKRATSNLGKAVMVDFYGNVKVVRLVPSGESIYITWPKGEAQIPVHNILRLTRNDDQTYRITYQDPSDKTQMIIQDGVDFDAKKPWQVKYILHVGDADKIVSDDLLSNYKDYFGPIL